MITLYGSILYFAVKRNSLLSLSTCFKPLNISEICQMWPISLFRPRLRLIHQSFQSDNFGFDTRQRSDMFPGALERGLPPTPTWHVFSLHAWHAQQSGAVNAALNAALNAATPFTVECRTSRLFTLSSTQGPLDGRVRSRGEVSLTVLEMTHRLTLTWGDEALLEGRIDLRFLRVCLAWRELSVAGVGPRCGQFLFLTTVAGGSGRHATSHCCLGRWFERCSWILS